MCKAAGTTLPPSLDPHSTRQDTPEAVMGNGINSYIYYGMEKQRETEAHRVPSLSTPQLPATGRGGTQVPREEATSASVMPPPGVHTRVARIRGDIQQSNQDSTWHSGVFNDKLNANANQSFGIHAYERSSRNSEKMYTMRKTIVHGLQKMQQNKTPFISTFPQTLCCAHRDARILNQFIRSQIKQHPKSFAYNNQLGFTRRMQGWFNIKKKISVIHMYLVKGKPNLMQ